MNNFAKFAYFAIIAFLVAVTPAQADFMTGGGAGSGGGGIPTTTDVITVTDQTGTLVNSRFLVNGTGTAVDTTTPGEIKLNIVTPGALVNSANSWSVAQAPNAAGTIDIGTTLLPFRDLYIGPAATNNTRIRMPAATAARVLTLPDADSNTVIPDTGAANNFLTAISAGGVISKAQPSSSNLSDAANIPLLNAANVFSNTNTFPNTGLLLLDTGGDHSVNIAPAGDEAANRTLGIPLLGGNDTISTLGLAQTVTGVKTMTAANVITHANTGLLLQDTGADHTVNIAPAGDEAANRTLGIPLLGGNDTIATLALAQTFTGAKTFANSITITGNSNGLILPDSSGGDTITITSNNQTANRLLTIPGLGGDRLFLVTGATAAQTVTTQMNFETGDLRLLDTGGDHNSAFTAGGNEAADRTLTVPLLGANATFAFVDFAQVWSANQTFGNTNLLVRDTGADHTVTIAPAGNEAANRTLGIPLLGGNDTISTLGLAQTVTGIKTMSAANVITHANTGLIVQDTGGDHTVSIVPSSNEAANRTLSIPAMGAAQQIVCTAAPSADGQIPIATNASDTYTAATLTQGSGVTITNGAGSITIAATGGDPFSGTGADGSTLQTTVSNGIVNYTSVTVNAAVTVQTRKMTWLKCTGTFALENAITYTAGSGFDGGAAPANTDFTGWIGAGLGGGGTFDDRASTSNGGGGGGNGTRGGRGGAGGTTSGRGAAGGSPYVSVSPGSGGGSGQGGAGSGTPAAGSNGGACLVVAAAGAITDNGTGAITNNGANAAAATTTGGGGGGGSGGTTILASQTSIAVDQCTLTANGGNGSNAGGTGAGGGGGAGGAGNNIIISPSNTVGGTFTANDGAAGNAGGAGGQAGEDPGLASSLINITAYPSVPLIVKLIEEDENGNRPNICKIKQLMHMHLIAGASTKLDGKEVRSALTGGCDIIKNVALQGDFDFNAASCDAELSEVARCSS